MTIPNFEQTFTRYIDAAQFSTPKKRQELKGMIDHLFEVGGSYAFVAGNLWLSDYSLAACQDWLKLDN